MTLEAPRAELGVAVARLERVHAPLCTVTPRRATSFAHATRPLPGIKTPLAEGLLCTCLRRAVALRERVERLPRKEGVVGAICEVFVSKPTTPRDVENDRLDRGVFEPDSDNVCVTEFLVADVVVDGANGSYASSLSVLFVRPRRERLSEASSLRGRAFSRRNGDRSEHVHRRHDAYEPAGRTPLVGGRTGGHVVGLRKRP